MHRFTCGLLAAAFITAGSMQAYGADLIVWWNKSYYPEEDEQFEKIVADFEEENGTNVELSFFTNEDVPVKTLAALTAGSPPDLAFG